MELRVFLEAQRGTSYRDVLAVARTAQDAGFDGLFSADHYQTTAGGDGLPGPLDVWATLAGLARETTSLRIGSLMSSATFRNPAQLAVIAAQVDDMSDGRLELGLGAGWFEPEHRSFGFDLPRRPERMDRLTEQLEIITGMWRTPEGTPFSYLGDTYRVEDNPALPKPVQRPGVPIIVGGTGRVRTPLLASRFASEYNVPFPGHGLAATLFEALDAACATTGRAPGSIVRSVALNLCVGPADAAVARRAERIGLPLEELRRNGIVGTPAEAAEHLAAWRDRHGVGRVYVHLVDLADLDQLDFLMAEVVHPVERG